MHAGKQHLIARGSCASALQNAGGWEARKETESAERMCVMDSKGTISACAGVRSDGCSLDGSGAGVFGR